MYKLELTISSTTGGIINTSLENEDVVVLKVNGMVAIEDILKEQNAPNGYFDVEMSITENGEYFDHEDNLYVYYDGEVKIAPVIGLKLSGKSNLPNLAIDFIEVELPDGTITTLDRDATYWDDDGEVGRFCAEFPCVATTDGVYIDGDILKNIKCISAIQVFSRPKVESPEFSIDEIEILENGISVGEIINPEIKEIVYEF